MLACRRLLLRPGQPTLLRPRWRPTVLATGGGVWSSGWRRPLATAAQAAGAVSAASEPYPLERLRNVGIIAHIDAGVCVCYESN